MRVWRGLAGTLLLLAAWAPTPSGTTLLVRPDGTGDYPTIQAAIDAAAEGDTVALADGIFTGTGNKDLDYHGKAITVCSQSGEAEACVIDCAGSGRGVNFHSAEGPTSVLAGIAVRRGSWAAPGGIRCEN